MKVNETIRVIDLVTGYRTKRDTVVISDKINASLYSRQLTCLLGPNGAGKSTLLKTLTAFIPPLSGEIKVLSKPLQDYSEQELAKLFGMVITEKLSVENMSVEELVGLGRSPYTGFWGRMSADDRRIVNEAISLVGAESLRGRMVQTLSDGERQKVMIAKALAQETPIIFLDEPTAFLDYPSKVEIMRLLKDLAIKKDKTVFLSTHDLDLALQIADAIWLIDKKMGVHIGTPEDLALNGELERYFCREGVGFDVEAGIFRIAHNHKKSLRVDGEQPYVSLVKKALARNGISADTPGEEAEVIYADASGFRYGGIHADSIEGLLKIILETEDALK